MKNTYINLIFTSLLLLLAITSSWGNTSNKDLSLKNYPECLTPINLLAVENGNQLFLQWEDEVKDTDFVSYEVQFSTTDGIGNTNLSANGNSNALGLGELRLDVTYSIQLRKICIDPLSKETYYSEWLYTEFFKKDNDRDDEFCDQLIAASAAAYGSGLMVIWEGPDPSPAPGGTQYKIQWKPYAEINWNEAYVVNGDEYYIENLTNGETYSVRVILISTGDSAQECDPLFVGDFLIVKPPTPEEDEDPEITLPDFICGEPFTIPTPDNSTSLSHAEVDDLFFIGGFPVKIRTVLGGSGVFSGTGIIPLPFSDKIVKVEFNNVHVNAAYEIYQGVVIGVPDDPANYPDIPLDPVVLGAEICQETDVTTGFDEDGNFQPTGLPYDPNGFDVDGNFAHQPPYPGYNPGDPFDPNYDPNGFDNEGNHVDTGTPYNLSGCSQLGFDEDNQPCDPTGPGPYYWLDNDPNDGVPTDEGILLANMIEDDIRPIIVAKLTAMYNETTDSVNHYIGECNYIKGEVNTNIANNNLDTDFIGGTDDEYIDQGLHQNFTERPELLATNVVRSTEQIDLEQKHIDLYDCDKTLHTFLYFREIIVENQSNQRIDDCKKDLLDLIKEFNPAQANAYGDSLVLVEWINDRVYEKVFNEWQAEYGQEYGVNDFTPAIDFVSPDPFRNKFPENNKYKNYWSSSIASFNDPLLDSRPKNRQEAFDDFRFQYLQGFDKINGIHRAFFLEEMAKQRQMNMVVNDDEYLLPIEVTKQIAGRNYTVYIDSILFTPLSASCKAYFILENPESGNRAVFMLDGIEFSPVGFSDPNLRLELYNDIEIRLSNAAQLNILGGDDTYVALDCGGFAGMGIGAEVEICRNYLVPLDEQTLEPLDDPERVTAQFTAEMPAWGQFVARLNFTPFALASNTDIKWLISNATLDLSDLSNPDGIIFPDNYSSPYVNSGNASPLWRGFYLEELSVRLPNKFSEDQDEIGGGVEDVIFDGKGFTGRAFVTPVLSLENGNLGGWAFSIDTVSLSVVSNNLTGGGLQGLIHVPILKGEDNDSEEVLEEDCVRYTATIEPGNNYSFTVSPSGNYKADLWKAGITIHESSTILISQQNDEFVAEARLNGSISLDEDLAQNVKVKLPDVTFQNLTFRNKAPYFSPGQWNLPITVGAEFAGFKMSMQGLQVLPGANDDEAGIHLTVDLGLNGEAAQDQNSTDAYITATGVFDIQGEMVTINGRQKWKYKEFNVNSFNLTAGNMKALKKLEGQLTFFKEEDFPTETINWGTGFRGVLDAQFDLKKFDFDVKAVAQFGNLKNNNDPFKYFMVDALVMFDGVDMGAMKLHGFGGGLSNNMNKLNDIGLSGTSHENPSLPGIGLTLSGAQFVPDKSKGIGIAASIVLSTPIEETFNFNATLGAIFNDSNNGGGFSKLYFKGTGRFMAPVSSLAAPTYNTSGKPGIDAPVTAYVDLNMDFNNDVFDGTFDVYVWVANGLLRGKKNGNGKFGGCEIHIANPDDWYINMGTPSSRNSLGIVIPGIGDAITMSSYIDVGTNLEPMPSVPGYVAGLTGAANLMTAESRRASGKGFAFGSSFELDTGELDFLIFYARFQAGMGYDVMLQKYNDVQCVNTGRELGINGWYASGQAWAYFSGDVGIKVRLFGKDKRFSIINVAAGAVMQAKLPNPFFARAYVGGHYSILGGLHSGSCKFKVELGRQCIPEGGAPLTPSFPIYDSMSPGDEEEGVSTMTIPTIIFGMEMETEVEEAEDIYLLNLEDARLVDANGNNVPVQKSYDDSKTFYFLKPLIELAPNTQYTITANVKVFANGSVVDTEAKEVTFTTGAAQTKIEDANILAAYPIDGQYNFHWNEYRVNGISKGHIDLNIGQPGLFHGLPEDRKLMLKLANIGPGKHFSSNDVNVNYAGTRIEFSLPNLNAASLYKLELVVVDVNTPEVSQIPFYPPRPTNLPNTSPLSGPTLDDLGTSQGPITVQQQLVAVGNQADNFNETNTPEPPNVDVLYQILFRSSQYATFSDKINDYIAQDAQAFEVRQINSTVADFEPFDIFESQGLGNVEQMVSLRWDYVGSDWLEEKAMPLIYDDVPQVNRVDLPNNGESFYVDYRIDYRPSIGDDEIPWSAVELAQSNDPDDAPPLIRNYLDFYQGNNKTYNWGIRFKPIQVAFADLHRLYATSFTGTFQKIMNVCSCTEQEGLALMPPVTQEFVTQGWNYEKPTVDDISEVFRVKIKYTIPGLPNFQGTEKTIPFQIPSN